MSLLALGEMAPSARALEVEQVLREGLAHVEPEVTSAAALSLGLLGHPDGLDALRSVIEQVPDDVARDQEPTGRRTLRAHAALAVGLLGESAGAPLLRRCVNDPDEARDVRVMACLGLRLSRDGHPASFEALARSLQEEEGSGLLRAHAAAALGGWARGSQSRADAVSVLVGVLGAADVEESLRRAVIVGLAASGRMGDGEALRWLEEMAMGRGPWSQRPDTLVQGLAFVALGQLGGRDPRVGLHGEGHEALTGLFQQAWTAPLDAEVRPLLWLGAALHARNPGRPDDVRRAQGDRLAAALQHAESDGDVVAGTLAMSLIESSLSREARRQVELVSGRVVSAWGRSQLAVAQARLGVGDVEALRLAWSNPRAQADPRIAYARALQRLGDSGSTLPMLSLLTEATRYADVYVGALSVVEMEDEGAAEALLALLADRSRLTVAREAAAACLGHLLRRQTTPWRDRITVDLPYWAKPPVLVDALERL